MNGNTLLLIGVLETARKQLINDHPEYLEEGTTGNDLILAIQHILDDIDKEQLVYKEISVKF